MISAERAAAFGREWVDAWNRHDLDAILAHYDDDVVFSSPFVATLTGDPGQTAIEGYEAVRSYMADSVRRTAGIAYTLDNTYIGTDSVILAYTFRLPDGSQKTGSDIMRVDGTNKVVEWRCHYPFAPEEVQRFITD